MKVKNKDGIEKEIIGQKLIVYNTVDDWGDTHTARITQRDGEPRLYPNYWTQSDIYNAVNPGMVTIVADPGKRVRELVEDGLFKARDLEHPRKIYRICGQKAC